MRACNDFSSKQQKSGKTFSIIREIAGKRKTFFENRKLKIVVCLPLNSGAGGEGNARNRKNRKALHRKKTRIKNRENCISIVLCCIFPVL